ncbi:phage major capsid protein, HK97 family [Yoonia tamlensis]|uniref:Phage major capsid protein, HK97 family n=1 Tax=Yoonia tamlensis TaxID=390270 RepID=A0A1I6GEC2_9RHOB|nr:phage major capsid protein [Yoonia tamlensis]SFR40529.1 phage major capsid protein, HK97 family [Yoonia tamlensis]
MKKTMMTAALSVPALMAHAANTPDGLLQAPRADAGGVSAQLTEVGASIKALREDVMPKAEEALKLAAKGEKLTDELKASIDKVLADYNAASGEQKKLQGQIEALETANLDLAQAIAGSGRGKSDRVSAGREMAESDAFKAHIAGGAQGQFKYDPKAAITSVSGDAGGLIWSERDKTPVNLPRRQLFIRNLLNVVPTGSNAVDYSKQVLRTNNAAMTAEGAALPESDYGWEIAQASVKKIGHHINVSEEALADSDQLAGEIDGELAYGTDLAEEAQTLSGDGTGQNLSGLITEATAFSAAAGLPNTDRIERLRLAILQVTLADYAADGIVLNPTDWAAIELMRETAGGAFLFGVPGTAASPALWRLPVVESNTMTAGEWLVGSMYMAAKLYDRQQNEILISTEHDQNFVTGMVTVKSTKRLALAVTRPTSLVTGDFTFA